MDDLLQTITKVADSIAQSIDDGTFVSEESVAGAKDGISLLSLKYHAMLSYIQNLALIITAQISRGVEDESGDVSAVRDAAVKGTIVDRVTLEKGVKGLESKLAYQIEKVIRAHSKAKQEEKGQAEAKESGAKGSDDENDSGSDSDEDVLNYRPNPKALANGPEESKNADDSKSQSRAAAKYVAPKIAAVTPFGKDHGGKSSRRMRNSTMEEFIRDSSDAPFAEPSIGSTIMDNGRGGERTEKDRRKQAEIQRYEEENYTRLPGLSKKQARKEARSRQRDAQTKTFFGEDWGLDRISSNNIEGATKRKKNTSVWDRAKKRRT